MKSAQSIRNQRRTAAKGLHLLAIGGIAMTLCLSATAIWLTKADKSEQAITATDSN